MATSVENRRAGREEELRSKLKATVARYEDVFGKSLTAGGLKEFLDESEKRNRLSFLTDRLGMLSDVDISYLRNILKENIVGSDRVKQVEVDVDDVDTSDLNAA